MASSGATIASRFWKNTIHGRTGCDQLTLVDSSWCSRKFPAVWKNFLGTIGARRRTPASGTRSPVGATSPPRSKYARMSGTSSTTTSSPSVWPTRPSSKVTSFMGAVLSGASGGVLPARGRGGGRRPLPGRDEGLGDAAEAGDLGLQAVAGAQPARRRAAGADARRRPGEEQVARQQRADRRDRLDQRADREHHLGHGRLLDDLAVEAAGDLQRVDVADLVERDDGGAGRAEADERLAEAELRRRPPALHVARREVLADRQAGD